MATTTSRDAVARRLREYQRQPGNWRLKGLLMALFGDSKAVGEAWPIPSRKEQPLVQLGSRIPDTNERALARSQYGQDAIRANEFVPRDEYVSRLLTAESATELDVLWREEIVETVQAGADIRRMARDASTVTPVEARKGTVPIDDQTPFARTGARSASASYDEANYKPQDYDCEEHSQAFGVTDEQVDQQEVGQIEYEIRRAGEAVENAINRQWINELLDNATDYDADLSGSGNTDVRDLLMKASETAADEDFDPTDTLVMHPEYASELFGNNQLAGVNAIRSDTVEGNLEGPVGHEVFIQSGTAYDSGSVTYGFESDGERGALVYGRPFVHIPVYRDVGVTEFEDPIRDIQGGVARAETDVVAVDPDDDGTYESVVRVQR